MASRSVPPGPQCPTDDSCERWWEAISACLDGEDPDSALPADALDDHLRGCATCAARAALATSVRRHARVQAADAPHDVTAAVMARVLGSSPTTSAEAPSPLTAARVALVVCAALQAIGALWHLIGPATVLGTVGGHAATDHAVMEIALAVAFATAAITPARAATILPMAVVAAIGFVLAGTTDAARGLTSGGLEVGHALALLGAVALAVLTRVTSGHRGPRRRHGAAMIDAWGTAAR